MPDLPTFKDWPEDAGEMQPDAVVQMYAQGFKGAYDDPQAKQELRDWIVRSGGGIASASGVAQQFGFAGAGEGKLSIPFVFTLELFPGCLPGPAQQRGSCVAHSTKNACLETLCSEIVRGEPDEVTGKVEGKPDVSAEGIANGVLSTEAIYWWRRHGGDGWTCPHAARVVCGESGMWLRQNYSEHGIDLTRYSARTEGKWGRTPPPDSIKQVGQEHLIRVATEVDTAEACRDFVAMGLGISTCGSEGFSANRNEHGVSRRQGSWAHAMAVIGFDDRPWAHQNYGGPLVLVQNSWGRWASGPRDIHDSAGIVPANKRQAWIDKGIVNAATGNIVIPEGSFWARWGDWKRRYAVALGGAAGWPTKRLPDFGAQEFF